MTTRRLIGSWRRRSSEPGRVMDSTQSSTAELSTSSTICETPTRPGSRCSASEVDDTPPVSLQSAPSAEQPVNNKIPESLERIVEQLVLQNIEIQRILQRKSKRRRRPVPPPPPRLYPRQHHLPTDDEGIYDTLVQASGSSATVAESLSDAEGDYVTIRPDEAKEISGNLRSSGGHFSRCALRRSAVESSLSARQSAQEQQPSRATLSRSLSCPARGGRTVGGNSTRAAVPTPSASKSSGYKSAMSSRIHKLLGQIARSPDQWSSWIHRSMSPPQPVRSGASTIDESSSSSKERNDPIGDDSESSPCVPSVWLRMQSEHLADPDKKSGSLPRSFHVSLDPIAVVTEPKPILHCPIQTPMDGTSNKSRWTDRPVTIASDRPAPIDALEMYLRSQQELGSTSVPSDSTQTGLDDSLTDITPPGVSADNIHIHPDYKIYRRRASGSIATAASKISLKAVLSSVSAKLSHHLRANSGGGGSTSSSSDHFSWGSIFSLSHEHQNQHPEQVPPSSSRNRVLHYLARQYAGLLLRQREATGSSSAAQHNAAIGARMAGAADCGDYATLKYNPRATPVSFLVNLVTLSFVLIQVRSTQSCYSTSSRSDLSSSKSTASLSSKATTSWYGTLESTRDTAAQMMLLESDDSDEDDGSGDDLSSTDSFFYERAFEAVELLLDEAAAVTGNGDYWGTACRDSAIFSDREDGGPSSVSDCLKTKPPPPPAGASSSTKYQPSR